MYMRFTKYLVILTFFFYTASYCDAVVAQRPTPGSASTNRAGGGASALGNVTETVDIDIYVTGADGAPIEGTAVVTLVAPTGQVSGQGTTLGGNIKFSGIPATQYTIQVAALGYENAVKEFDGYYTGAARVTIEMRPALNGGAGAGSARILLAPKAQKELGKALEALRANKPAEARSHLDAAYRRAPNHPAVNYLFGVYYFQTKDQEKAKSHWTKALEFDPKHQGALLSLSEALMREQKLPDAESYVKRAVEADPSSWRAHAILADILLKERMADEAVKEAERAVELGHGQAGIVQPLLAQALMEGGNRERAIKILQEYVQDHPNDAAARKRLDSLQSPAVMASGSPEVLVAGGKPSTATETAITLPLPSNWLPPDVDEKVPLVEPGASCALDEVLQKAGKRVEEFVKNVDRFTASEFLKHESMNKWGFAQSSETRKFDYVASIDQYRPGLFSVMEYRSGVKSVAEYPDGVATNGLPGWNGVRTWQVHFRQRPDKPNTMREYKIGEGGPAYPVSLRGRAWIAADSYQIMRMETDLIAALPEIKLVADHELVDYGPVRFKNRDVEMWLPQTAQVYFDWRGRWVHRSHTFSNYLLFSVDEKQRIAEPKTETKSQPEN
ncbi:MAG: hypothetical protein DMG36_17495 [Acidobacteria bacterium]|nr:MAG: hypothetical protein DMG36_17495 [Acidobacteriota bacterium]